MAKTRPGRKTSTGGRETHQRSAAASCVGQAATSRGTVSWTETLQVANINAVNECRGTNLLCLISDFHLTGNMKMETFSPSTPAHLRNLREPDRQVQSHMQLWDVMFTSQLCLLLLPHLLCFWDVLFWKLSAACLHIRTCFFPRDHLYKKRKRRGSNKVWYWVQKQVCTFNRLKV